MPADPYITVTLKKDVVKRLVDINPEQPTSALVTIAIQDYIQNKSVKTERKTSSSIYSIPNGTSTFFY